MPHYIDFIKTMPADRALAREFRKMIISCSADELSLWFEIKGYEVSVEECGVIIQNNTPNLFIMEEAIPYLFLTR